MNSTCRLVSFMFQRRTLCPRTEWSMYIFQVEQAKIKIKGFNMLTSSSAVLSGQFLSWDGSDNINYPKVIFSFMVKI